MSRDPLGIWGDPGQVGSGQSYCGNNPVNRVDPMGLTSVGNLTFTETDGGDILVTAKIKLEKANPDVPDEDLEKARERLRRAMQKWADNAPPVTDPRTGRVRQLRFAVDFGEDGRVLRIHHSDKTLPEAENPGIPEDAWKELQETARRRGDRGVRKHTQQDLSMEAGESTWVHELGHTFYLPDDDDSDSLMNTGAPTDTPSPHHYWVLAWLALADSDEELRRRLTIMNICGVKGDLIGNVDRLLAGIGRDGRDGYAGYPTKSFLEWKEFLERQRREQQRQQGR